MEIKLWYNDMKKKDLKSIKYTHNNNNILCTQSICVVCIILPLLEDFIHQKNNAQKQYRSCGAHFM